ncbi:hypothetical protein acdb102_33600 [Acidothermaceae bacterium B102]|nr:hypothetical protein acdb102_33600 [Acidothermaceae bacterium B102]
MAERPAWGTYPLPAALPFGLADADERWVEFFDSSNSAPPLGVWLGHRQADRGAVVLVRTIDRVQFSTKHVRPGEDVAAQLRETAVFSHLNLVATLVLHEPVPQPLEDVMAQARADDGWTSETWEVDGLRVAGARWDHQTWWSTILETGPERAVIVHGVGEPTKVLLTQADLTSYGYTAATVRIDLLDPHRLEGALLTAHKARD